MPNIHALQVCVFRCQNKLSEAIQELNSIVSAFYSDFQSWLELADIYITVSDFKVRLGLFPTVLFIVAGC